MVENIKRHLLNAVLLLVLLSSCKKDVSVEIQQENQSNINELKFLVTQVKTWHDSTISSNLRTKIQNGVSAFSVNENDIVPPIVDWDKAFINFDSSTVKSITLPISMNYKNGERKQLVATKSKNKINGYFIKITPDSIYYAIQNNIYDYTKFSGSIAIYNLLGVRLKKQEFKTGEVSNPNNNNKTGLSNITTFGDGFNTANDLLTVTVKSKKRKKYQFNYGYIYIEELQNIELDEGDSGDGVIAGGDESPDEPFDIRNKIINPCLSSLVDKIINSKISDQLNKDLKNVFGVNNKINLVFEEAKLKNKLRAKSERDFTNPDNYTISIDLSNFDPKASEEYVASVIVHEISHMLIANTFSDHGIYNSTDREKLMLDNYVNLMQSFLVKNFNLQDKQALSMIYMGMGWLQDKIEYKFWNQEIEDYYFKKIEESGFNQIMNDPDYYDYYNNQFSKGILGTNPCKF